MKNTMTNETKTSETPMVAANENSKDAFNIVGRCFVKTNSVGGEILSFVSDESKEVYLDDILVIFTVPSQNQHFAPTFVRMQDKSKAKNPPPRREEIRDFVEVRETGYLKERSGEKGDLIICAPRNHAKVDLARTVFIATIPPKDRSLAPVYIRMKKYERSKAELGQNQEQADEQQQTPSQIPSA